MDEAAIHQFRKDIDALILKAEQANISDGPRPYGREMAIVRTKLQEAKMWAGQCLGMMGNHLPEPFRDFTDGRNVQGTMREAKR